MRVWGEMLEHSLGGREGREHFWADLSQISEKHAAILEV